MEKKFELIPGRYGIEMLRSGEQALTCRMDLIPSLEAADGSMRAAALLMAVDMACGASAGLGVVPDWTVTADAEVHLLAPCSVGPLRAEARCIRAGRKMSVSEARLFDEGAGDRLVAIATANHGVLTPKFAPPIASSKIGSTERFARPEFPSEQTLEEYFGLEITDGEARVPLGERTRNPWGIFHGGIHGLLIDATTRAAGLELKDVVMRFLNPVRDGDAVARVVERFEGSGESAGEILRIEVFDAANDRVAVVAHVVGR